MQSAGGSEIENAYARNRFLTSLGLSKYNKADLLYGATGPLGLA
jgi:hypothetical protein